MKICSFPYSLILSKHFLVLKTSSRHVVKTSWTRLQRNNFLSSKTSCKYFLKTSWRRLARCLQDILKTSSRRLQDVLEDEKLLRWRRLEDVLEINKMFTRISVLIHGLLRNLNQYLTNLYFTNLRRIQNALIRTQQFLYLSYFEIQSAESFQNQHYRTGEAIKTKF